MTCLAPKLAVIAFLGRNAFLRPISLRHVAPSESLPQVTGRLPRSQGVARSMGAFKEAVRRLFGQSDGGTPPIRFRPGHRAGDRSECSRHPRADRGGAGNHPARRLDAAASAAGLTASLTTVGVGSCGRRTNSACPAVTHVRLASLASTRRAKTSQPQAVADDEHRTEGHGGARNQGVEQPHGGER